MALEAPLSLEFIKDYFTSTYTTTSSNVSFRSINSTLGRTTPDGFSDFLNNQVTRFTYVSGADGAGWTGSGDLFNSLSSGWATFQDTIPAGTTRNVRFNLINTYHYGYLTSKYQVRYYVKYNYLVSGSFTGNIFLQRYESGSWITRAVLTSSPSTTYAALTPYTSGTDLLRVRTQNLSGSNCTLNLSVGMLIVKI